MKKLAADKPCCTPKRGGSENGSSGTSVKAQQIFDSSNQSALSIDTVHIEGGTALLGTDQPIIASDEEGPVRKIDIDSFRMMSTTVTNEMFRAFIDATGYKTDAERFGWSFVFDGNEYQHAKQAVVQAPWWRKVDNANWQNLHGMASAQFPEDDHPVVHVSWNDANAFAQWAGGRLPLEREWEHAARGGQGDVLFPWGNTEPDDNSFTPCNIWQGDFPDINTCRDGYEFTAPADAFEPNAFGLFNMSGNVWEWSAQSFKVRSHAPGAREHKKKMRGTKVLKGGSFLCHRSYCYRYRIASRTGNTPDTTTSHQGFRLVFEC